MDLYIYLLSTMPAGVLGYLGAINILSRMLGDLTAFLLAIHLEEIMFRVELDPLGLGRDAEKPGRCR
jgi:hypothetical protein